jgi:GWxTD domain-containing protein
MRSFAIVLRLEFDLRGGTVKRVILFAVALAAATAAMAQLSKYKDWPKSPEAYFLTTAERADWANVKSDEDADKFIAAYYARRGGDRFKAEIARRIEAADQQFKQRRQRGAESPRGKLLIVLGSPSRVSTTRPQQEGGGTLGDSGLNVRADAGASGPGGPGSPGAATQTWTYMKDKFDPSWGVPELAARISVDAARGTDELQNRAEVDRVLAIAAEKSVVSPAATGAPAPAAASGASGAMKPAAPPAASAPASSAAPPPPAPAPVMAAPAMAALPAATRSAVEAAAKSAGEAPGFWGGTFFSIPGDAFYALELSVTPEKVPGGAKFAGVVTNEAGADVATFYEDAALTDSKAGPRTEKVFEKSVVLPPGSYRGSFSLVTPDGATPLVSGSASFQLGPRGTEFQVSPLILASTLTPLTKRPSPTDPFVFGMEKPIRVDPKASRVFGKDENLWYFYTVANTALAAGASAAPAPAATPAPPGAAAAPAPAAEPKPRIMTRIAVTRDGKPAFEPATLPAELQPLAPNYYATGIEIPLAGFEPGFYTFSVTVRDLNAARDSVANKGIERKQDFIVLKPDGSMPDKKAAAPAGGAPKPKPTPKK